jgi:hypothetical protein
MFIGGDGGIDHRMLKVINTGIGPIGGVSGDALKINPP